MVIIAALFLLFLYFRQSGTTPGEGNTGTNFISQFNPFGTKPTTGGGTTTPPIDVSGYQSNPGAETNNSKLKEVSSMPIAGFTVFSKERLSVPVPTLPSPSGEVQKGTLPNKANLGSGTFAPAVRYVDEATGNIYQTFADKIAEQKFSATIIPKVYDAYFGNNGESVVMRYLKADEKTIETFVGILPKELLGTDTTGNNEVKGSFLPDNVEDIAVSPDTSKIFYLFKIGDNPNERMAGVVLNLLNNKKIQVFDSPFTEWLSFWRANNAITLSTKPSASVPGYMYGMDSAGKNLTKVLGEINGLTTQESPNGKLILYGDSNLSLNIYNTDTRNSTLVGVKTLPEKCVWGSGNDIIYCAVPKSIDAGSYPDTWYQGETSFNDQIWKIDVKTGDAVMILDLATSGAEIDGIKLSLDKDGNYLFFVNKKDSFLWEFNLK